MSTIDKEKMRKLLAQELPHVVVASALGCSEGYISQCLADPNFAAEVSLLKVEKLEECMNRDAALDRLENRIIEKLDKATNLMFKPMELVSAFKVINAAKRSNTVPAGATTTQLNQQVTIIMPQSIAVSFIKNAQGEIIEAGGRSLTTLPASVLKAMAQNPAQIGVSNNGTNGKVEQFAEATTSEAISAYQNKTKAA